jgi:hypothetical protein
MPFNLGSERQFTAMFHIDFLAHALRQAVLVPVSRLQLRFEVFVQVRYRPIALQTNLKMTVFWALMVEAANTSEMSINFYRTTRRNNSEDSHLHTRRRENLKSHFLQIYYLYCNSEVFWNRFIEVPLRKCIKCKLLNALVLILALSQTKWESHFLSPSSSALSTVTSTNSFSSGNRLSLFDSAFYFILISSGTYFGKLK